MQDSFVIINLAFTPRETDWKLPLHIAAEIGDVKLGNIILAAVSILIKFYPKRNSLNEASFFHIAIVSSCN